MVVLESISAKGLESQDLLGLATNQTVRTQFRVPTVSNLLRDHSSAVAEQLIDGVEVLLTEFQNLPARRMIDGLDANDVAGKQ